MLQNYLKTEKCDHEVVLRMRSKQEECNEKAKVEFKPKVSPRVLQEEICDSFHKYGQNRPILCLTYILKMLLQIIGLLLANVPSITGNAMTRSLKRLPLLRRYFSPGRRTWPDTNPYPSPTAIRKS